MPVLPSRAEQAAPGSKKYPQEEFKDIALSCRYEGRSCEHFPKTLRRSMRLNLNELSRKFGQRAFIRFTVPGAAVSWMPQGQESFSETSMPLSDISRGGLSFLANEPPAIGSDIFLHIFLPQNKETIELLGRVVYANPRGPGLIYRFRVGVELKTFAPSEGGNSPHSLKVIETFEWKYAKRRQD
jgi:Tfp pilus assembly protein PilZ